MTHNLARKKYQRFGVLLLLAILIGLLGPLSGSVAARPQQESDAVSKLFLPILYRPKDVKVLLGAYPQLWTGEQANLNKEFKAMDAWSGEKLSIVGTFLDIQDPNPSWNVNQNLSLIWDNGYTPFVNLMTNHSSASIANGTYDSALNAWAQAYKAFATGNGGRMAFIAPLPEMNGEWSPYYDGGNKSNYKAAYAHIRQIFQNQGVPASSVRWVFVPNGFSKPGDEFENYYPGDASVDVVGYSAYNFGYSSYACAQSNPKWQEPDEVFNDPYIPAPWAGHYLDRMRVMAPSKPIFIAQTGTTAYYSSCGSQNRAMKDQWLRDAYDYLVDHGVAAVIYFNLVNYQNVDWPVYDVNAPGNAYQGYKDAVTNPAFYYLSPADLKNADLSP